jgi:hypothetical protein
MPPVATGCERLGGTVPDSSITGMISLRKDAADTQAARRHMPIVMCLHDIVKLHLAKGI